jgi:hypothetical protein
MKKQDNDDEPVKVEEVDVNEDLFNDDLDFGDELEE